MNYDSLSRNAVFEVCRRVAQEFEATVDCTEYPNGLTPFKFSNDGTNKLAVSVIGFHVYVEIESSIVEFKPLAYKRTIGKHTVTSFEERLTSFIKEYLVTEEGKAVTYTKQRLLADVRLYDHYTDNANLHKFGYHSTSELLLMLAGAVDSGQLTDSEFSFIHLSGRVSPALYVKVSNVVECAKILGYKNAPMLIDTLNAMGLYFSVAELYKSIEIRF